jgi:hypothetical protein
VPVVAQQFVDGVIRLLKPETAAEYAWLMYDIEGAEAFNTGETDDPTTVGIEAVDDYTLAVTLSAPTSYFETVLPFSTFYPVRLDIIEEFGDLWTEPGNYLSNGAYLLEAWEHEAEVVLVKNDAYWDADNVTIEKITLPVIMESATSLALFENDELHVSGYPSEEVPRILEENAQRGADPAAAPRRLLCRPEPRAGPHGQSSVPQGAGFGHRPQVDHRERGPAPVADPPVVHDAAQNPGPPGVGHLRLHLQPRSGPVLPG